MKRPTRRKSAANQYKSVVQWTLRLETLESRMLLSVDWRNPVDHLDVNSDSRISAIDALLVINELNRLGSGQLPPQKDPTQPYFNTTGDSRVSALDALWVINHLNSSNQHRQLSGGQLFDSQQEIYITMGHSNDETSRFYRMQIDTTGFASSPNRLMDDLLSIYLVSSTDPTTTLLDRGANGTSLFSLSARGAELAPGLVRWDGNVLEIDIGSIPDIDTGILRAQLLSRSPNSQAFVNLRPLSNAIEEDTQPGQLLRLNSLPLPSGSSMNIAQLSPSNSIQASIGNIRYDRASGVFAAEAEIENLDSAVGRNVALVLPVLPNGVQLTNASGTDSQGRPYLNLREAIRAGGLGRNERSELVELLISNPNRIPLDLKPEILVGPSNSPPVIPLIASQTVMPGNQLEIEIGGTDPDGDRLNYSVRSGNSASTAMPNTRLDSGTGSIIFEPTPDQLGQYQVEVTVNDGALTASRTFTLNVVADPITTTRISGRVLDVDETPIAGMQVEIGGIQGLTQSDGRFSLDFGSGPVVADTLKIRGEMYTDPARPQVKYPFIAEKIRFMFGREVYQGYNNVLQRPIFLPKLNNGTTVNPALTQTVTQQLVPNEAAVAVRLSAGTLLTQQGAPFTGALSITEVPPDRTPVSLPPELEGSVVVTIQPGDMTFSIPAPITLPNRSNYPANSDMDIWSINPTTGEFEIVGKGKVSADGSKIETISGGIRFSSWHAAAPPPTIEPEDETKPPQCDGPKECTTEAASEVAVYSGNYIEDHTLPTYSSLGVDRGLTLVYNSSRANPSQIIRFNTNLPAWVDRTGESGDYIAANIEIGHNRTWIKVPAVPTPDAPNLHRIPVGAIGPAARVSAGIEVDTTDLADGQYFYSATVSARSGEASNRQLITVSGNINFRGGDVPRSIGSFNVVRSEAEKYGTGWGIAGLQRLLITKAFGGSENGVIVIDGGGVQTYFEKSLSGSYISPVGDYSVLSKKSDNTYQRRMKDGMVYLFDDKLRLATVTDRNGNQTLYSYDDKNRLISTTDPVGLVTTLQYGVAGLSSITLPDGRKTLFTVDGQGNLSQIVDPDGSTRRFSYDDKHRMVKETTPLGFEEKIEYDNSNRVRKVTRADGSSMRFSPAEVQGVHGRSVIIVPFKSLPATEQFGTQIVTTSGNVITNRVNRTGQVIATKDNLGTRGNYIYNDKLQMTETTDSRGNKTELTYDSQANVTSVKTTVTQQLNNFDNQGQMPLDGLAFPGRITFGIDLYLEVASGDNTNDGVADLIGVGTNIIEGNSVSVIATSPGDGLGGFLETITTELKDSQSSASAVIVDLNGDGRLDVATMGQYKIHVHSGGADGKFTEVATVQLDSQFNYGPEIRAGDVDGDGRLDIFAFARDKKRLVYVLNEGDFQFGAIQTVEASNNIDSLEVVDLTGDTFADLIFVNTQSNSIEIQVGDGSGLFVPTQTLTPAQRGPQVAVADFSGDGHPDLAIGGKGSGPSSPASISLYRGDGTGMFIVSQTLETGFFQDKLTPIDLNGNGNIDLAILTSSGNLKGLKTIKNSLGTFGEIRSEAAGVGAFNQITGDLNNDGKQDLIRLANSRGVQVLLQDAKGTFDGPTLITTTHGDRPSNGDFNGDGNLDIVSVVAGGTQFQQLLGDGNGGFSEPILTDGLISSALLGSKDFDNDGRDDLLAYSNRRLSIFFSGEDGLPGAPLIIDDALSANHSRSGVFADFNGDGLLDFVIAGRLNSGGSDSGPKVRAYLSESNGTYARQELVWGSGDLPYPIVADVDGDGRQDVLVTSFDNRGSYLSGAVHYLRNQSNNQFAPGIRILSELNDQREARVESADFNQDGKADIVASYSSVKGIFLNDGTSGFSEQPDVPLPQYSETITDLQLIDLNNDDALDIVTSERAGDGIYGFSVLLGLGDSRFSDRVAFRPVTSPITARSIVFGDYNSDNAIDILFPADDRGAYLILGAGLDGANSIAELSQRFTYGSFSQLSSMTDELGRKTQFQIDPVNGNILGIQRPLGANESMTYTSKGLLDIHTDELGRITDYDYDSLGRVTAIISAKGIADESIVRFGYDSVGNIASITDPLGNLTRFEYDALRRITEETDALGGVTHYTRDAKGNVLTITDALGRLSTFTYDSMSRLTSSTDPLGNVTRFGYDIAGNQISVTDPNGNVTRRVFDVANRLIRSIDPDGGTTKFSYDREDNLLSVTDPVGNVTRYFYDERNRVVRELDTLGKSTYFLYDGVNNLIARKDRNDRQTHFTYDSLDRLTMERWQGTRAGQYVNTITSSYDIGSNLLSIEDNFSKLAFTYDSLDRVKTTSNTGTSNAASVLLSYAYDDNSNRLSITDTINGANGATVVSQFDALDRLKQMTQTGASISTKRVDFGFNAIGQYTSIARSNNADGSSPVATTAFSHDVSNRLSLIDHKNSAGTSLSSFGYGYDSASRITQIAEKNQTIDYGYDDRDQLVSAIYGDAARTDEAFKFDANGNRVESNAHGTAYRTGPGNRLTTDGVYNYAYDAEGNLTKRTEIATGNTREFQWDHRNRLTMLSDKNASGVLQQVVRYSYDSLGRRISKQVDTTPLDTVDAAIEQYVYDGEDVILDFVDPDGSGPAASQQTTRYLRGPGIDNLLAIESANGTNWVLQDHLGSTRALVSSAGVLVQSIDYDSFGKAIVAGSPSTRYLYTGRELDAESGLFYYRARYYDSSTGRFTNEDPIGFAGGSWNTQIYVDNSPISWIDPMGLAEYYYSQGTGQLKDSDGKVLTTGYAGRGKGVNNPGMQDKPYVGPIPKGKYVAGDPVDKPNTGKYSIPLIPDEDTRQSFPKDRDPDSFYMHGDNRKRDQSASHGCPIIEPSIRKKIKEGDIINVNE